MALSPDSFSLSPSSCFRSSSWLEGSKTSSTRRVGRGDERGGEGGRNETEEGEKAVTFVFDGFDTTSFLTACPRTV